MEGHAAAELLFGLVQILRRWLDAHDESRRTTFQDGRAERARAAADVEPALSRRNVEPPFYLLTRSSMFEEDFNPWTQRDRLPKMTNERCQMRNDKCFCLPAYLIFSSPPM